MTRPAIRIPVTHANRARLRRLRHQELQPWIECGLAPASRPASSLDTPAPDVESQAILLVLATAAFATLIQRSNVLAAFLELWEGLRQTIEGGLR